MAQQTVFQRNFEQVLEKMAGDPLNKYTPTYTTDGFGHEQGEALGDATLITGVVVRPITAQDHDLIDRGYATSSDYIIHATPDVIDDRDIIDYPVDSDGTVRSDTKRYVVSSIIDKARPLGGTVFDKFAMKFTPR